MSEFLPNSYQTPNAYVDQYMHLLTPEEWMVLSYAARRIFGFNKRQDRISLSQFTSGTKDRDGYQLDHGTGLAKPTVMAALAGLIAYRLMIKVEQPNDGKSDQCGACYALQMDSHKVDRTGLEGRAAEKSAVNQKRTRKARQVVNGTDHPESETGGQSDLPQVVNGTDREWSMGLTHNKQGKPGKTTTTPTPPTPVEQPAPVVSAAGAPGGGEYQESGIGNQQPRNRKAPKVKDTAAAAYLRGTVGLCDDGVIAQLGQMDLNTVRAAWARTSAEKGATVEQLRGRLVKRLRATLVAPPAEPAAAEPIKPYMMPGYSTWTVQQQIDADERYQIAKAEYQKGRAAQ